MTWWRLRGLVRRNVTLPSLQPARLIARRAAERVLPITFGTRQRWLPVGWPAPFPPPREPGGILSTSVSVVVPVLGSAKLAPENAALTEIGPLP
jgi:hypothetical protein